MGMPSFALDGILFSLPGGWEPVRIGRRHLILRPDDSAGMEIRWEKAGPSFPLERRLNAFIKSHGDKKSIKRSELPPSLAMYLTGYKAAFFAWEDGSAKGIGLFLLCKRCHTATLVQFFGSGRLMIEDLACTFLESFTDHFDGGVPFSIFGMKGEHPQGYELCDYSFEPGSLYLSFEMKGSLLSFYSFGPAEYLLQKTDLAGFAKSRRIIPRDAVIRRESGRIRAEWVKQGLLGIFKKRCSALFWESRGSNRIFGVMLSGNTDVSLDEISESFGQAVR